PGRTFPDSSTRSVAWKPATNESHRACMSGVSPRPCFRSHAELTEGVSCSIWGEVSGRWFVDQDNLLHGDLVASVAVTRRFDLTDGQWALLEPLLPKPKKPGRPPKRSKRQLIDGIRWRVRAGAPWRDVPDGS